MVCQVDEHAGEQAGEQVSEQVKKAYHYVVSRSRPFRNGFPKELSKSKISEKIVASSKTGHNLPSKFEGGMKHGRSFA